METENRTLSWGDIFGAVKVVLTRPKVSLEIFQERVETCQGCTKLKQTPKGQGFCSVCKCNVGKDMKEVFNLAAYKEKLPKHGCLHPFRGLVNPETGRRFGWKR